jgi:hypothetical protein
VAAAGEPLRLGVVNNGGADQTVLVANATGATFTLKSTNGVAGSTGIFGWASAASDAATKAIYARVDAKNGDALVGKQGATTSGTGAAVRAIGGLNDGLVATTDIVTRAAISAAAPGRALNVNSTASGIVAMRVETANSFSEAIRVFALGASSQGVVAYAGGGSGQGIVGEGGTGVIGWALGNGSGVRGNSATSSGYGVYCDGHARVTGDLRVSGSIIQPYGGFTIDDPADPAGHVLEHAHVGSSERLTVYSGNVRLGSRGEATVRLPDWFEALNEDVRYQLTTVGEHAPVYVKQPVRDGRFVVGGGSAGLTVSWQITARRRDRWSQAHPLAVRSTKRDYQAGRYLQPVEHGRPANEEAGLVAVARPRQHDD